MTRTAAWRWAWAVAAAALFSLPLALRAETGSGAHASSDVPVTPPRVALMPLANYTASSRADSIVILAVERELTRHGLATIPTSEIRPVLRARRIRSQGSLGRDAADSLRSALQVDYFLLGSVDFWQPEGSPEVGISLRLLGGPELDILGAVSVGATGDDFAGLFGAGRIDSIGMLADRVVEHALRTVLEDAKQAHFGQDEPRLATLVVIFDNASDNPRAGDIATGIMVSALHQAGYRPLEPGFAQEVFFGLRIVPRGGIDLSTAETVWNVLGHDLIVTGEIQVFRVGQGMEGETPPNLELGVRVLDGPTGEFLLSYDQEYAGPGTGEAMARGRRGSLTDLTLDAFREILGKVRGDLEDRSRRRSKD